MQRIHIKLDRFALHPTVLALHLIVLSPSLQDVAASEVANLPFSFVNKLPVSFNPFAK